MSDLKIEITVNGFSEKVPVDSKISHLISHFKEGDPHLLVEHNGQFIHPRHWDTIAIEKRDVLEFIHPCFGG